MRSEDRKPSRRVFPLLQNLDLDTVTFAQVQSTGNPISIEDMNEQEMLDLIIVNAARLCVKSEWDGLLSAGSAAAVFVPFSQANTTGDDSFIPTCPIATGWTSSSTLEAQYDTPSHYPFYSGDYTEVVEYSIFFTGAAGTAGTSGSLAIYTLSTSSDAGWAVGRPMEKVTNSEVSYATDTSGRVEITPGGTVALTANTWYSIAIVGDASFATYPTIRRANEITHFWGDANYGGLKAASETNYTLPASYTTSTTWSASSALFYIPKVWWRGTN
jgi:hypothetical protein